MLKTFNELDVGKMAACYDKQLYRNHRKYRQKNEKDNKDSPGFNLCDGDEVNDLHRDS